jgi:hypothetical protein
MRKSAWLLAIAAAMSGCGASRSQAGSPSPVAGSSRAGSPAHFVGPCGVRAVDRAPARIAVTRVKIGFWHGETSIQNLIALADGSFMVVAETPGTTGYNNGPGTDYIYRVSADGHVLEERHDWRGDMMGSPINLSYFFSAGPGSPQMWRDPSGVSHVIPGAPADIYFRDLAGRFWRVLRYSNVSPGGLWVSDGTQAASKKIGLGRDSVATAAAGCDGAVWALTTNGHVWRVGGGGRTARVVMSLPTGTGVFGSTPYDDGSLTAMSDGSVWLLTSRDDQTIPISARLQIRLLHLGADGLIGEASPAVSAMFLTWAEGPDGALWAATVGHRLVRLSAQGGVRSYPAPATQYLALDAAGRLWFACQPYLCTMTSR